MFGNLFKKRMSVDAAVDSVLSALTGFDRMQAWGAELSEVSGLQLEKVKEEMFYLDCFAVYIVLKFTHYSSWKQNGMRIFEKVFQGCAIYAATTLAGKLNATIDEAKKGAAAIDNRFSVYSPIFERSENTLTEIGTAFSKFCEAEGNPVIVRAGADLFNVRGYMLTKFAQEHPVSD